MALIKHIPDSASNLNVLSNKYWDFYQSTLQTVTPNTTTSVSRSVIIFTDKKYTSIRISQAANIRCVYEDGTIVTEAVATKDITNTIIVMADFGTSGGSFTVS